MRNRIWYGVTPRAAGYPVFSRSIPSEHEKAQTFASPENRTAENKYYAARVNALIDEHTSLERTDPETAKLVMEETLEHVTLTHLVR